MDVSAIANAQVGIASYAKAAKGGPVKDTEKARNAEAAQAAEAKGPKDTAVTVDISEAGKAASVEGKTHGDAIKGLTSEQVDILQEGIKKSYELMIKTLTSQNTKLQAWLDNGDGILNFSGVELDTAQFALPAVGTTPEEAAEAIAPGGEYSVEKVADRIMGLAQAFAGEDPDKLKAMQDAIEEGFKQAGVEFKDATGEEKMPDITQQTHDEITRRFEELYKKIAEQNAAPAETVQTTEE